MCAVWVWRGGAVGVAWVWRGGAVGVAWVWRGCGVGVAWVWRGRNVGVAWVWRGLLAQVRTCTGFLVTLSRMTSLSSTISAWLRRGSGLGPGLGLG